MVNNAVIREKVAEIQAKAKTAREWWDKERANIQSQFMKELDSDAATGSGPKTAAAAAAGNSAGASDKMNSDEDAVLVEGGGPASSGSALGKGGKKKKGKK